MKDCPQCSVAVVNAKEAFSRVVDATRNERRNILPNGDIDWDAFCDAVENSLTYALTPRAKKGKR